MSTPAQITANRRNAEFSTGPRTAAGKARSSRNAVKHDLRGRAPIAVLRGPFQEDPVEVQAFVEDVVTELDPVGPQELAEAIAIAGLYVRRRRLHELEAMALAGTTHAELLPPAEPGGRHRITYASQERAAAQALTCDLLDRLPRYEAHLSREIDRCSARMHRLQEQRSSERTVEGQLG